MHVREPERGRGLIRLVERRLGRLAAFCYRHYIAVLVVVFTITAASVFSARSLRIDANLSALLPEQAESVADVRKLEKRVGGVGYLTIVARGSDPVSLREFADKTAPRIEALESVRFVEHRRPTEFFEDRALYFVETEDLQTVRDRLQKRADWERIHANPLYVDLEEEDPPSVDVSDIEKRYKKHTWLSARSSEPYYMDRQETTIALLVKPTGLVSDLHFTRKLVDEVTAVIQEVQHEIGRRDLEVAMSGQYKKGVDQHEVINADLKVASVVALVLVLLYLGVHFRSATSVILVILPLVAGLAAAYGFAAVSLGSVNILTAFIGVILLGLGIDSGIHLLARYEAESAGDATDAEAIARAFGNTGRAAIAAALTTAVAFASLTVSEFRGFREFGILAGTGVALMMVSYLFCLPALMALRVRLRGATRPGQAKTHISRRPKRHLVGLISLLVLGGAAVWSLGDVQFNSDFGVLAPKYLPSYRLDTEVHKMLGHSQSPLVVFTDDLPSAKNAAEAVRLHSNELGDESGVHRVVGVADLVPEDQAKKHELLLEIREFVGEIDKTDLSDKDKKRVDELMEKTAIAPFTHVELPVAARRPFKGRDADSTGEFVLVFPGIQLADGAQVRRLADELRDVKYQDSAGKPAVVTAAGEVMIFADILDVIATETPRSVAIAGIAVLLVLWLLLGRISDAALSLVPAAVTVVITLGMLPLAGLELNYLNVIVLPVLIGMGVDGGAHIVARVADGHDPSGALEHSGLAVVGALTTTALGFGALVTAHHPGLESLAYVALIGLAVNMVATVSLLPRLLELIPRYARSADDEDATADSSMA